MKFSCNFMTIKSFYHLFIMFIFPINCFSQNDSIYYLGKTPPGDVPKIFTPGLVSLKGCAV